VGDLTQKSANITTAKLVQHFRYLHCWDMDNSCLVSIQIEAEDVGPLLKIRIGHDGKGMLAGWFLEKVCSKHTIFVNLHIASPRPKCFIISLNIALIKANILILTTSIYLVSCLPALYDIVRKSLTVKTNIHVVVGPTL